MSDLIDRQAAIDALGDAHFKNYGNAIMVIQTLSSAEPVRHGKWMWVDGVRCSQCNYKLETTGLPNYCPNCGADMRGEE